MRQSRRVSTLICRNREGKGFQPIGEDEFLDTRSALHDAHDVIVLSKLTDVRRVRVYNPSWLHIGSDKRGL
jgi:hypothetical protein